MADDSQQRSDDLPPLPSTRHQTGPEDISGTHFQQSTLSKEKLYQQRQKCELRRLLKHTHPELKMLDDVVDEELAEVLSSETEVTTGETGYEGEVLSRRLLFENCASSEQVSPYVLKRQTAEGAGERGKTSAVLEKHEERHGSESAGGIVADDNRSDCSPDPHMEGEEDVIRIDVKATRRIFESQCMNTSGQNVDHKFQAKVSVSMDQKGAGQKENLRSENKSSVCTKSYDLKDQPHKKEPHVVIDQSPDHRFPGYEDVSTDNAEFEDEPSSLPDPDIIKTSAMLFKNNPFIQTNIEREHSSKWQSPAGDSEAVQEYPVANVKNRANLFESMPFDKIRHQNRDEVETMVENIKETLISLYHANVIHSGGSIIEVNETMIAKKAKFTPSESGPKIIYDEVAEGGAQNFILQLLPRANRKPEITYLKQRSDGSMETKVVNVPVHQHHFASSQDTEFKTANVVQVVEDILNQDNSLRKGVIIQEGANRCAEVMVYSLYNYFDEEDVKSYCSPQVSECNDPEAEKCGVTKIDDPGLRKGTVESAITCLLESSKDQSCQESVRPEIPVKGNVKLFKSCIEKGDLEYLKSLQAEETVEEQENPPNQNVVSMELHHEQAVDQADESTPELVPVDVKRLKNMFSGDQRPVQPKQNPWENYTQSRPIVCTAQATSLGKIQPTTESSPGVCSHVEVKNTFRECGAAQQVSEDEVLVHKAELVEVVDEGDEISNLQSAIQSLQQATAEAKSLHHQSQENRKFLVKESPKELFESATEENSEHSRMEAKLPQQNKSHKEQSRQDELPSPSNITSAQLQPKNTETSRKDLNSEEVQTTETCSRMGQNNNDETVVIRSEPCSETPVIQQDDEEVVFEGKLQAALNSLEKSNINVTRGDFRAAMIYRGSSRPHKDKTQHIEAESGEKPTKESMPANESKSTQAPVMPDVSNQYVNSSSAEPPSHSELINKPATSAEKTRTSVGQRPVIPPKPENLKAKPKDIQPTKRQVTETNTERSEGKVPQPVMLSDKPEQKKDAFQIKSDKVSGMDTNSKEKERIVEDVPVSQENKVRQQVQDCGTLVSDDQESKYLTSEQQKIEVKADENPPKDNENETDESHVDFHEACRKFGGKKASPVKTAPVKPKRVKIAQPDNKNPKHMSGDPSSLTHVVEKPQQPVTGLSCNEPITSGQTADSKDNHNIEMKEKSKVEMRERKGRAETEDERRQRLSVHMDEIMRGNITAAMEIFDNLRKQEELKSILSRVEEIEQDTSDVDVKALRGVFENVPGWVVSGEKKKQKKKKRQSKDEKMPMIRENTESKSPMAHVFGDLERASEEIMNLKEQTLARLMDIEEAIKKALYSVSTLKSDSDIAGLSCLFKESLGTVQVSPSSGNISKISIGSSKSKATAQGSKAQTDRLGLDVVATKQQTSPLSSPAFISIQSAARKTDKTEDAPLEICPTCQHSPKQEEKFRSTKTVTCNSPAQNRKRDPRKGGQKQSSLSPVNPNRELSVLEVQTDRDGNSVTGTKMVTENYERTDNLGNRFYSTKTSTVITTQPETTTSTVPPMYQITTYPEVVLPINQKP